MDEDVFIKSDIGAQAAWKGFSSQTLYIAYRLVTDIQGYEYYPCLLYTSDAADEL